MKILHVIHDHPAHPTIGGGGAVRVHEISRRLARRGHDVHVVSGSFFGCEDHAGIIDGYRQSFLGPARRPACKAVEFAFAAWKNLPRLAEGCDVVIEDFSPYSPLGAFRLERPGRRVFLQIQNYFGAAAWTRHGLAGLPIWTLERGYPRLFPRHLLVGAHLLQRFRTRRSDVVPMGFTPPSRPVREVDRNYIAYLGRLDFHQKGLDVLLEALAGTDLPVWFAGAGREEARLREALRNLPASRYIGRLDGDAKWDFLAGARFLVMPSRFEGQPIVAIETAAAGTPLLASPIAELDFVASEGTGRQFPRLDAATLRKNLVDFWHAADERQRCTAAAKHFAARRNWDQIAEEFERVLIDSSRD